MSDLCDLMVYTFIHVCVKSEYIVGWFCGHMNKFFFVEIHIHENVLSSGQFMSLILVAKKYKNSKLKIFMLFLLFFFTKYKKKIFAFFWSLWQYKSIFFFKIFFVTKFKKKSCLVTYIFDNMKFLCIFFYVRLNMDSVSK